VAAGFGRHGMPPPASNNTGTAYATIIMVNKDVYWAKTAQTDHVTLRPLTLAPVADARRRPPSVYQV